MIIQNYMRFQSLTVTEVQEIAEEVCAGHQSGIPAASCANEKTTNESECSTFLLQGNMSSYQQKRER
jgi:hypothetical protein